MRSNIDIQKVIHALGDSNVVNLDVSLRDIVSSPAADLIGAVSHLEDWDWYCYTWVMYIRRGRFDDRVNPATIDEVANPRQFGQPGR